MAVCLTAKCSDTVPLEVDGILPSVTSRLTLDGMKRLPIFQGNRQLELSDGFDVEGDPADGKMLWGGDLRRVHRVGEKMKCGHIEISGDAGRHVGTQMSGGTIRVLGSVGDFAGVEMRGGQIVVEGDAGDFCGSAFLGSRYGMNGGQLLIHGCAGRRLGSFMRRGLIAVAGDVAEFAALNMLAGTMVLCGAVQPQLAADMRRGTVCLLKNKAAELLPTYQQGIRHRPLALDLVFKELDRLGFPLPSQLEELAFDQFHGDMLQGGRGEVFCAV